MNIERVRRHVQTMLDVESKAVGLPVAAEFRFDVSVEAKRPNKGSYDRLDFPVYVVGPGAAAAELVELILAHRATTELRGTDLVQYVQQRWTNNAGEYGLAVPAQPATGSFAKLGFVDESRLSREFKYDLPQTVANVVVHEVVHMSGVAAHDRVGLMGRLDPLRLSVALRLSDLSRNSFFSRLGTLRVEAAASK